MNTPTRWGTPKRRSLPDAESYDLIELVNQLQNKLAASGHSLDISLPQIVVVGCQSAGKSSVLENVVGREFLPRGTGVVTRRPTVVQLEPCAGEEYAVFLHRDKEKFKDFQEVKKEIMNETLRDPGVVGFSSKPISLKIYSPNVLKLTLVDLPGMISVTIGDQSEECIEEVRKMILQYIQQPNSLILAVTPANQDIANSDALAIAKTVDPERVRTIGVLTKLDLMDDGTDAREILENKKIPLTRGYVGVLNRSQKDIDEGKDIQYCWEKEKHFFASMPCYKHLADRMGSPYLQKMLHQQLRAHIKDSLPTVRKELSQKLSSFMSEMKEIQEKIGCAPQGCDGLKYYMIKLVQEFVEGVFIQMFGYSEKVEMNELSAGVLVNFKLYRYLHENLKLLKVPERDELLKITANMHGIRNGFSMPSISLEAVSSHMGCQYIEPLDNIVENISRFLFSEIEKSANVMNSYSNLKEELLYQIKSVVDQAANDTKDVLKKYVKAAMYFVNIHHEDFKFPELTMEDIFHPFKLWDFKNDSDKKILPNSSDYGGSSNSVNDSDIIMENLHSNVYAIETADHLAEMSERYLLIQKKQIGDIAIKFILYFLVKKVMDFAKNGLIPRILASADVEYLLEDCAKDFNRISELEITIEYLEDALAAVQHF